MRVPAGEGPEEVWRGSTPPTACGRPCVGVKSSAAFEDLDWIDPRRAQGWTEGRDCSNAGESCDHDQCSQTIGCGDAEQQAIHCAAERACSNRPAHQPDCNQAQTGASHPPDHIRSVRAESNANAVL